MFSTAAVFASLAIIFPVEAFLIPSISSFDVDIIKTLPIEAIAQADSRSVNLQCTTCPLAISQKGGKTAWVEGVDSYLQLDFSIINEDVLLMNGVQIYPPRFDQIPETLTALQVAHGTNPSDASNQHLRLGYELSFHPIKGMNENGEKAYLELLAVHFQVAEIGNKFVDGLESVEIKLLRTLTGKLMIAKAEIIPTSNPPLDPSKGGTDCTTMICKFRAVLDDRLSRMKSGKTGCSSKAGYSSAVRHHKHHGGPHSYHHGHHYRGWRLARFMHKIKNIAIHVLIPVFIGVAVGMTASIVGMIAGQMIVFFWRAIYRNDPGNHVHFEQEKPEEESNDETKPFLENQGPPPVYNEFVKDQKTAL